jgi:hypothetical protein
MALESPVYHLITTHIDSPIRARQILHFFAGLQMNLMSVAIFQYQAPDDYQGALSRLLQAAKPETPDMASGASLRENRPCAF